MLKKALLAAALVSVSMSASANWVLGVGYSNLSDSEDDIDISLGAIVASAGYKYAINEAFTLVPELRYGIGVSDDEVFGVDIELDSFYAFTLRGEFDVSENVYAYVAPSYGKLDERIYTELATDHPIDLTRYQVANGYMGRCGLIHSGGASEKDNLRQAVRTAVVNKRGGGMGMLAGRKAFQGPMAEGVALLHAIQDVYLNPAITVA